MKKYLLLALALGCGAYEDGSELGQEQEPLGVFSLPKTFGSNGLNACDASTPATAFCNWMEPYEWHPFGGSIPTRYAVVLTGQATTWTSDHLSRMNGLLNNTILPMFNGDLIRGNKSFDRSNAADLTHQLSFFPWITSSNPPAGDTNVRDYIFVLWNGCQSTDRTETPSEPGRFRSCSSCSIQINTVALQNNFPAARFTGNLYQTVAFAFDLALGAGAQTTASGFSNPTLSQSQQASSTPFTPIERASIESALDDGGVRGSTISFN